MIDFRPARVAPEKAVFRPALPSRSWPGLNGQTMTMSYKEQLLHPNWQRRRLEMLEGADWRCQECGDSETTLHVHHKRYIKGRKAWEYEAEELAVLCEECHRVEHANSDLLSALLAVSYTPTNVGLLGGFLQPDDWVDRGLIEAARQTDALGFAAGFVAYLTHSLSITQMREVAQFAASLANENAESRLYYEHSRGKTFGEEAA